MSVSIDPKNGVKLRPSRKPGRGIAALIIVLEAVFSVFLYMSLAEKVFVVIPAGAQPGAPELIAYQGLLTDSSGNPLGGSGSVYCFRYSIWDVATGGTTSTDQLWPTVADGDASTTPSNSTTTVTDGVFSDELGRMDILGSLDFGADTNGTSTYYLQVQVSTSSPTCASGLETLSPRQQITSDAWSQTAQSIYGNQLRTLVANNTVQIGTGAGTGTSTVTLLSLDVVNVTSSESIGGSCTQNGTLWYDSTLKVALVCANKIIQSFSNGTSTINSVGSNGTSSLISSGEVYLSGGNNITLSQTGNTITVIGPNVPSATTLSYYANLPFYPASSLIGSTSGSSIVVQPFVLPYAISASYIRIPVSLSIVSASGGQVNTTTNALFTSSWGRSETDMVIIYTQGVGLSSQSLSSYASASATWGQQTLFYGSSTGTNQTSWTGSINITYPLTGGYVNYASSYSSLSSTYIVNTGSLTNFTGQRFLDIPFVSSLSPGNYWIAFGRSTNTAGNGSAIASAASMGFSMYGITQPVLGSIGYLGSATATSTATVQAQLVLGLGYLTTNANIMSTQTVALSRLSTGSNNQEVYFQIINQS
jgi:hypothetical protein